MTGSSINHAHNPRIHPNRQTPHGRKASLVSVIGVGSIGSVLARQFVRGGESVAVASADFEHAKAVAEEVGARAMLADDAIASSDIVVFAVLFDVMKQLLIRHRAALRGKIVVDPTNPVVLDDGGGFKKIIPEGESAGEIAATLVPPGARLVKAFGTQSARTLASSSGQQPLTVQFYAADDADAGAAVADLIRAAGYSPVLIGGIDQSMRIEAFGDLHETTLGATLTDEEARKLI